MGDEISNAQMKNADKQSKRSKEDGKKKLGTPISCNPTGLTHTPSKKNRAAFRMCQIVRDSGFHDLPFSVIDRFFVDLVGHFNFPVFIDGMKHTDKSIFFSYRRSRHPPGSPDPRPVDSPYHPDSPSGSFYAGKPGPTKFLNALQIINTRIPTVKHDIVWLKSLGLCCRYHLTEWSFFDISSPSVS